MAAALFTQSLDSMKRLAIIGSAVNFFDDFIELVRLKGVMDNMGINDIPCYFDIQYKHWVSLHPERFQFWKPLCGYRIESDGQEKKLKTTSKVQTHGHEKWPEVDQVWSFPPGGSSGLFAVRVALALGYQEVYLCGVPMDATPRFTQTHSPRKPDYGISEGIQYWEDSLPFLRGRVFSMSGRTKQLLGGI